MEQRTVLFRARFSLPRAQPWLSLPISRSLLVNGYLAGRICSAARLRRTGGRNGTAPRSRPKAGMSTWRAEPDKEQHQCETKAAYRQENPVEKIHDVPATLQLKFTRTLRSGRLRRRIARRTRGVTTDPAASLQNEAPRVLKRSRPGNGRRRATNSELLLHRS